MLGFDALVAGFLAIAIQMQQAITALVHRLQSEVIDRLDFQCQTQTRHVTVDSARGFAELATPDHRENMIARQHATDIREEQLGEAELRAAQN